MKKSRKILTTVLALTMLGSMVGCGGGAGNKGSNSEQTLDIYLLYKGYGDSWLKAIRSAFEKEEWVKEKYPNLRINYKFDSVDATPWNKIQGGASINDYDLLFGSSMKALDTTGLIADLTDTVYLTKVPGEDVLVKDKIPSRVLESIKNNKAKERADGEDTYNLVSYVDGIYGMLCNYDLLEAMELPVPLTTDQFLEVGAQIKEKKYVSSLQADETTVIMNCAADAYWQYSYDILWGQYVGTQGMKDFFEGYDPIEARYDSISVLDQNGRLQALTALENILRNYSYESSMATDYKKAQTAFLAGKGVFHFNGDYFTPEMMLEIEALKEDEIDYDIRWMKMPVLSAIVENTPTLQAVATSTSKTNDQVLREVIQEIDADKTYDESNAKVNGISEKDFEYIAAARCVNVNNNESFQTVVIPSYSPAIELASDFLRYFYTDASLKLFVESSNGIIFPSTYDVLGDEDLQSKVHPIELTKFKLMAGTTKYPQTALLNPESTRLGRVGLTSLNLASQLESMFVQTGANFTTARDILDREKNSMSGSWQQLISTAN